MRLSVQLFTLRSSLENDLDGTLRALRELGLEFVELAGYHERTVVQFKAVLDAAGLQVSGSHVGIDQIEADLATVIAESRILGNEYVIVPWVDEARRASGWGTFGRSLEAPGKALKAEGMSLAYHNHDFEFVNENGKLGLDALFEGASAEFLKSQLDVGWVAAGGQDPMAYIAKLGDRLSLVHLKDYSGNREKPDAEAGDGVLDWDAILPACTAHGVRYGAIEMDTTPGDPIESVARCTRFFQAKGLD